MPTLRFRIANMFRRYRRQVPRTPKSRLFGVLGENALERRFVSIAPCGREQRQWRRRSERPTYYRALVPPSGESAYWCVVLGDILLLIAKSLPLWWSLISH